MSSLPAPAQTVAADYLRLARLHRHRGGQWEDFWSEHGPAIREAYPVAAQRADLVNRLMEVILMGMSGRPCEEIEPKGDA